MRFIIHTKLFLLLYPDVLPFLNRGKLGNWINSIVKFPPLNKSENRK